MIKIWVCKDWNKDYKNLGCFGWDRSNRWDRPAWPVVHDLIHLFWPITNKIITLSLSPLLTSSLSLSPSRSLSPSIPHRALPLPQIPNSKSPSPNQSHGQESFKSVWRAIFPAYSSPGSLGFWVLRVGKKLVQDTPTCAAPIYLSRRF